MSSFDIDAYPTDHGWVSRVTRLNRFGEDEAVFYGALGTESENEEDALRRGVRWVLSRSDRVRKVTRRAVGLKKNYAARWARS
jgi:hypothetical protein